MKKALILGVSGQDGGYLAKFLLSKGYDVYGASRDAQMSPFHNLIRLGIRDQVHVESVAINDFRSILQSLTKIEPDEVYNLAGQSSVDLSFQQPVETFESIGIATINILETIKFMNRPIKFYNSCSGECFGDTEFPADEATPFHPKSPYAVSKAAAYWQVTNYREAYKIYACSGILFNHESPLRPERFVTKKIISTVCRILKGSGEMLYLGNIDIVRDWGWAQDYVEAMWLMLQQDTPQDFVVATGKSVKLKYFVEKAFGEVGLDWNRFVKFDPQLQRPTDLFIGKANPEKARRNLGWAAQYLVDDVIRLMIQAEIENSGF
jgi:GDPmannose 4,6-dehydratase